MCNHYGSCEVESEEYKLQHIFSEFSLSLRQIEIENDNCTFSNNKL